MPASTSQRRTKPKVRRNSDVIAFVTVNHTLELALPRMISIPEEVTNATGKIHSRETVISIFEVNKLPYPLIRKH